MPKILEATCVGGVVSVNNIPVPTVTLLSEGVGSSTGFLIIDEDELFYVAKTSPDLDSTLEKILSAIGTISDAIGDIATGPVTNPGDGAGPTVASLQTALNARISSLEAVRTQLETLKAGLK